MRSHRSTYIFVVYGAYLNVFRGSRRLCIDFNVRLGVFECILGLAEALKNKISCCSIDFSAR